MQRYCSTTMAACCRSGHTCKIATCQVKRNILSILPGLRALYDIASGMDYQNKIVLIFLSSCVVISEHNY